MTLNGASDSSPLIRAIQASDYAAVIDAHINHYSHVEKFDDSFHSVVTNAVDAFKNPPCQPMDQGFVLEIAARFGGSVFCVHETKDTARVKLFYLIPALRQKGYGRKLLLHCFDHVRRFGYHQVIVSTYTSHAEACKLYRRMGFLQTSENPVQAYGRDLVEVSFTLDLEHAALDAQGA